MKDKVKNLCNLILFCGLALFLFVRLTYMFVPVDEDRNRISGIKAEENLDMVYVGASSSFAYWSPLCAWDKFGFASYVYSTNNEQPFSTLHYIEEVRKYQEPELFVIDLRPFENSAPSNCETEIRKGADSMDISLRRWEYLRDAISKSDLKRDSSSMYFRLGKYHAEYDTVLGNPENWELMDNNGRHLYRGYELLHQHIYQEKPENFETEERGELTEWQEQILQELLDYCREEDLRVVFVVSPYILNAHIQKQFNTMQDRIEEAGYEYLNTNLLVEDMGICYEEDFYNTHHLNFVGAEKFTEYLGSYLVDKYGLKSHRGEGKYSAWDRDLETYEAEGAVAREELTRQIESVYYGSRLGEKLRGCEDLGAWVSMAQNENYILVITKNGAPFSGDEYMELLGALALPTDENYACIRSDKLEIDERGIGGDVNLSCVVSKTFPQYGRQSQINVTGSTVLFNGVLRESGEGLTIWVYNHNLFCVEDCVNICEDEGGTLVMRHVDDTP